MRELQGLLPVTSDVLEGLHVEGDLRIAVSTFSDDMPTAAGVIAGRCASIDAFVKLSGGSLLMALEGWNGSLSMGPMDSSYGVSAWIPVNHPGGKARAKVVGKAPTVSWVNDPGYESTSWLRTTDREIDFKFEWDNFGRWPRNPHYLGWRHRRALRRHLPMP